MSHSSWVCLSARILSWWPASSLAKGVLTRISSVQTQWTRLTFSLMDSGVKENYVIHWHSVSIYCVASKAESWERGESYTWWNMYLFQPGSQDQVPFTIVWPSWPSACVGQVQYCIFTTFWYTYGICHVLPQ